ncbi:hypothetical protein [Promicromonospora sp. NFX87]|uniref:AbiTii domain-containing protein n=1 Tax=Promicromonospora sp. NFX87 TaxID=3402691 RepID=UPI003AFA02F8
MASALDRIIDGASDPSVSTANLLRSALAAARRLRADTVRNWVERELAGYDANIERDELPVYRRSTETGVEATWSGYNGATTLVVHDVSDDFPKAWFLLPFRQPVSELERLAASDQEIGEPWPAQLVLLWNSLAAEGKAAHVEGTSLFSARIMVQKASIVGVLDAIRTEVMKLALDLQDAAASAGEPGGPTVEDAGVQSVITTFHNHIYGGSPTIAQGANVTQTVTVNAGDLASLSKAAQDLGLGNEDLSAYVAAVLAAREEPSKGKLVAFVDKVRSGAVTLAGGVAGNIAAEQLMEWAAAFLGS